MSNVYHQEDNYAMAKANMAKANRKTQTMDNLHTISRNLFTEFSDDDCSNVKRSMEQPITTSIHPLKKRREQIPNKPVKSIRTSLKTTFDDAVREALTGSPYGKGPSVVKHSNNLSVLFKEVSY